MSGRDELLGALSAALGDVEAANRRAQELVERLGDADPPAPPEPEPPPAPGEEVMFAYFEGASGWTLYVNPLFQQVRVWSVFHSGADGRTYPWRDGKFHAVIGGEMNRGVAPGGLYPIRQHRLWLGEGRVQVCMDNASLRADHLALCWLVRPERPCESRLTEAQWRRGASDGVILPFGRDHLAVTTALSRANILEAEAMRERLRSMGVS